MHGTCISIVVPIYKVEAYLDRCVQSLVDQTYTDLEIILVDDGSPDRCGEICDEWEKKDTRIKVVHKENGGLSDARNAGMAVATGEYIGFIDSDDYIAPRMFELLYRKMQEDNSDIAACGVQMVWEDDTPSRSLTKAGSCVMNTTEALRAVLEETWLKQPVWYKLYKTALVKDLPFAVGKYHEDVFWTYQAVARSARVSVFDTPCYFYVQRGGSIMGEGYSLKRLDAIEASSERLMFIARHFPELTALALTQMVGMCMYHHQQICAFSHVDPSGEHRKKLHKLAKNSVKESSASVCGSVKQKIWLRAYLACPGLVCTVRNKLGLGR